MLDTPVYKLLARNDTGSAPGHQGGLVVPGDIEDFFPDVVGTITPGSPTADVPIVADLIVDNRLVGRVTTRYQYQTWGGKRSHERRLTSNLGAFRNAANVDDMALFSRDPEKPNQMTITLVRKGSELYNSIVSANPRMRWGLLPGLPAPASNQDIRRAEAEIETLSTEAFALFDDDRPTVETPVQKKARDAAFRKTLLRKYGARCLVSGEVIDTPAGLVNLDAAHIVPVEAGGSDDPRNGLLLSKDLHWAFDRGLFSISADFSVILSEHINGSSHGEAVKRVGGAVLEFGDAGIVPHGQALAWHREHKFIG